MSGERQFQLDSARVVHETIDGETIAIDLTSGTYFSITGCGPAVWAALVAGAGETALRDAVDRVDPSAAPAVSGFIDELIREGLLEVASAPPPSSSAVELPPAPLIPPRLERYSDMEHLLLLDPIHEVEAAGWPETAPTAPPR